MIDEGGGVGKRRSIAGVLEGGVLIILMLIQPGKRHRSSQANNASGAGKSALPEVLRGSRGTALPASRGPKRERACTHHTGRLHVPCLFSH